jgi:hypothetical protein
MAEAFAALVLWVERAAVRLAAIERVLKTHLNVSEEQWIEALRKADADFPPPPEPRLEGFAALKDFAERARKHE